MKRITIGGKEYTIKFSVEASLYNDCTKTVLNSFVKAGKIEGTKDADEAINSLLDTLSDVPQRALTLFYAGLMENHGKRGDKSILSIEDAKEVLTDYIYESRDEEGKFGKTFSTVLGEMIEIMEEDNFFGMIGLDKMLTKTEDSEPKKRNRKKS